MMIKKIFIIYTLLTSIYFFSQRIINDFNVDRIKDTIDYKCYKAYELKNISEPVCKIILKIGKSGQIYQFDLSYVAYAVINDCGNGCISLFDASKDTEYTSEYLYNKKYNNWILVKNETRYNYENGRTENYLPKNYLLGIDRKKYMLQKKKLKKAYNKTK